MGMFIRHTSTPAAGRLYKQVFQLSQVSRGGSSGMGRVEEGGKRH